VDAGSAAAGTSLGRQGTPRVLLVEDDASLGQVLKERLSKEALDVTWRRTSAHGAAAIAAGGWALVILDVKLPDGSGFDLARQAKQASPAPVMLMTALNSAANRLRGFNTGADEYLPKPFHLREFLLRVRHVLATQSHAVAADSVTLLHVRGREIDLAALSVVPPGGTRVFLPARDGAVLALLIHAAPKTLGRHDILDRIWGPNRFPTARVVDNVVVRLRQALQDECGELIQSVRGVGYRWGAGTEDA
jgi:DNA-binding response OmpR family regulator